MLATQPLKHWYACLKFIAASPINSGDDVGIHKPYNVIMRPRKSSLLYKGRVLQQIEMVCSHEKERAINALPPPPQPSKTAAPPRDHDVQCDLTNKATYTHTHVSELMYRYTCVCVVSL